METAIQARGVTKRFGPNTILDRLDLEIGRGESLVVLGPSGSGKTTLLRIIAGLETLDEGEIELHGVPATTLAPQKRQLGVVFQEHALFQRMTVEQNIGFGLEVRGHGRDEIRRTVDEMLDLVRLAEHRHKRPAQLSGGQRQRVAVARALAFRPEAMLFDEPFSALDAVTRSELRREVRQLLRSLDVPALFITHDQEEALELADRIAVLNAGRIEQVGTPFEVYNHPRNEFVATFLGAANVLLGRWSGDATVLGAHRLKPPAGVPMLAERQPVKVVFRPEDVVVNFQPQYLDTPFFLGNAVVEEVSYVGPTERLVARVMLWNSHLAPVDDPYVEGFPITITRSKYDATEMELSAGDAIVVGLKDYRLLPHYPLRGESGAKVVE
jgi:ABC-type Fe3+/spermidine/putrescine transport system ATPase subunit